jgi:geranylgeranyl diphosphate synthase type II
MPAMLKVDLSNSILNKFEEFGRILGISFQIKDDLLGYTISTEILGKTKNKDEIRNQPNYVNILGVDNAKKKLEDYKNHINELLIDMKIEKSMLFEISNYIFKRHF